MDRANRLIMYRFGGAPGQTSITPTLVLGDEGRPLRDVMSKSVMNG